MEDREHQEEIVAQRRPILGITLSALAVVGLAYLFMTGGQPAEEAGWSTTG